MAGFRRERIKSDDRKDRNLAVKYRDFQQRRKADVRRFRNWIRRFLDWLAFIRVSVARWVDGWWGYDVFIAHRRAHALVNCLSNDRHSLGRPGPRLLLEAERSFSSALFVDPLDRSALKGLGSVLIYEREIDAAESSYAARLHVQAPEPELQRAGA